MDCMEKMVCITFASSQLLSFTQANKYPSVVSKNCFCLWSWYGCVCLPLRHLLTSGMMWCDMKAIWLVKQVLQFCMAAIISIVSSCGFKIEARYRLVQPIVTVS